MRSRMMAVLGVAVVGLLAVAPAGAKRAYQKVKGEVVRVEQQLRTENGGEYDRLTIRTRQGEELQLRLGEGGACEGCFQEGDRIRARIQIRAGEGSQGDCEIQSMKVKREQHMFKFQEQNGRLVRLGQHGGRGAQAGAQSGREGSNRKPGSGKGKVSGGGGRA